MKKKAVEKSDFEQSFYSKACRSMILIIIAQIPIFAVVGGLFDTGIVLALLLGSAIAAGPLILHLMAPKSEAVSIAIGIAMLSMSGLLIHLGRGMIEMHFHVFVSLAILIGLARVSAILAGTVTIAVHHVAFFFLLPESVFNYDASFVILAVHAGFVIVEAIPSCLVSAKFNRFVRAQAIISGKLNRVSTELQGQTGSISGTCKFLAEKAASQAASIEETSASLEELSSVTQTTTANASEAKEAANRARIIAEKGASEVALMNEAMQDIRASSNNIANIIKSIDEIAFQTNILALNAAVEAARAGEAGAGFAVVADEVRNLAQRSALAAQETAEKIEDSVSRSERGVEISGRVAVQLEEIFSITQKVDELIAKIADASIEQNQGLTHISEATHEIDRVTQESVSKTSENAHSSEQISALTEELRQTVYEIDKMLGTRSKAHSSVDADTAELSMNSMRSVGVSQRETAAEFEDATGWN